MRFTSFIVLGAASLAIAAPVAEPKAEPAPVDYGSMYLHSSFHVNTTNM